MAGVQQLALVLGLLVTAGGLLAAIVKQTSNAKDLLHRLERLERRAEHRKNDAEMTLRGIQACLQGLKEQGCNGPVTATIDELNKYLIESR